MSSLRIAFITMEFVTESYFSGGVANHFYRILKKSVSLGHEAHIITYSEIDRSEFEYDGIHVHRVTSGWPRSWLNRLTGYRLPRTVNWLDLSFQAYRKLRQLHTQKAFDIVQMPNSYGCGLATSLLMKVPYVVMISCYRPLWRELSGANRNLDARAIEWLEWLQARLSKHTYAPSYTLKRILAEKDGIRNVRVIRTPTYLETVDWDRSVYNEYLSNKNYLLFFGRFQLHKGIHILAQALPQFLEMHPDSYAAFAGLDAATKVAPSMKEYVRSLCGKNADRLVFIGQVPHAQLYPVIADARLVVLPSLIDNLPNTCLEAMRLGRPVVGTIGASFDEIITDGENGFLVPVGDVDALAAKLSEAWTHPRLDEIGQAAQRKVQEYAPERTVRELLAYYREILNNNEH